MYPRSSFFRALFPLIRSTYRNTFPSLLTLDQVIALAPDAASVKASRPLSNPRKWDSWASDGETLWGLAKGSGKKPYQTQIALAEPAFKCSCPSRKFPCKHALALMFMAAATPDEIPSEKIPDWVREWLTSREARAEKKATAVKKAPDSKAAAKRKDKKLDRISEGVASLTLFIEDLARQGIADPSIKDPETWDTMAKRMVDAQAPGLASRLRGLRDLAASALNWETPFLHSLGNLHLLLHSWSQRSDLDPDLKAEVEQLVGLPVSKEEVLATKAIEDSWFVAARSLIDQDRLQTFITWLVGQKSGRWAKTLKFGAQGQKPLEIWPLGSTVTTGFHFYPGITNPRALPANEGAAAKLDPPSGFNQTFSGLLETYASLRAKNPWHRHQPFLGLLQPGENNTLVDNDGMALTCRSTDSKIRLFHSLSGGHPILTCAEWDGLALNLLSAHSDGQLLNLT